MVLCQGLGNPIHGRVHPESNSDSGAAGSGWPKQPALSLSQLRSDRRAQTRATGTTRWMVRDALLIAKAS
jgi:hypothetical protein